MAMRHGRPYSRNLSRINKKQTIMKESFYWIRNCINSSTNNFHLEGCKILIELFENKYIQGTYEEKKEAKHMASDLYTLLQEKETFLIVEV